MELKVGANGSLSISVDQNKDVVLMVQDDEKLTAQSVNLKLHPQALASALESALGAANKPWVKSAIDFLVAELLAAAAPAGA